MSQAAREKGVITIYVDMLKKISNRFIEISMEIIGDGIAETGLWEDFFQLLYKHAFS